MSGWTSKSAKVSSGATGSSAAGVSGSADSVGASGAVSATVSATVGSGASVATPRVGGGLVGLGHGHLSIGTSTPTVRELSGA